MASAAAKAASSYGGASGSAAATGATSVAADTGASGDATGRRRVGAAATVAMAPSRMSKGRVNLVIAAAVVVINVVDLRKIK